MNAVQDFERAFAGYVGAKHAIAMGNGTLTLEVALRALGVKPGDRVATTPLTMSATSIAILNVGAVPVYCDVDPETWLMKLDYEKETRVNLPVSLYGLHMNWCGSADIDDAAQTLRPHRGAAFTSYSFQGSKILALGEGGMLVTNVAEFADLARSIGSLGYDLSSASPRISKDAIKDPRAIRHVRYPSLNARMNDATATLGLALLRPIENRDGVSFSDHVLGAVPANLFKARRIAAAALYRKAVEGCEWITKQKTPDGWVNDHWAFAVALDTPERWEPLAQSIVKHGGKRPFACWLPTYFEPAFKHLAPQCMQSMTPGYCVGCEPGPCKKFAYKPLCPVAESLQPRIMAFQTNNLADAERNATALCRAIQELNG